MKLQTELFGASFQNPVMLAAGTCGFGLELADVMDLDALGGFVTKSVTLESRAGNPAPRVAECSGGMLNSIGLTLVNTLPGILLGQDGLPALGAGPGGLSGPALRPVGLLAVRKARLATRLPLVGVGGVGNGVDAVAYARAGASLVQVGTASFADPRSGERIVRELGRWGRCHGVPSWDSLIAPVPGAQA